MRRLGLFSKKVASPFSAQRISGVISPIVTPLNADFSVDTVSLKNIVARLLNKGVQNFFVFSRFSEFDRLLPETRAKVLQTVSKEVKGRGLVIAGCFALGADEILELVKESSKFADACVVNVPPSALMHELRFADFFELLMSQTKEKIILYNNNFLFGESIPINWLGNFINWENLLGIIDASRNPDYFEELSKFAPLTKLFEENEEFAFDALRKGFAGITCVSTILFPAYYLQLIENFDELDYRKLMRNEAKVFALNKLILPEKRIQAVKHVLALQGIIQPYFFDSLEPLSDKEKYIIDETLGIYRKA
ncbi:MAG: dihydrodipicolinate synthase family protein [archaeon]